MIGLKHARECWVCKIWKFLCRCVVFIIRAIATQVLSHFFLSKKKPKANFVLNNFLLSVITDVFILLAMLWCELASRWTVSNSRVTNSFLCQNKILHLMLASGTSRCCTWCLQVAPPILEFVVYLINVLCSFEQNE